MLRPPRPVRGDRRRRLGRPRRAPLPALRGAARSARDGRRDGDDRRRAARAAAAGSGERPAPGRARGDDRGARAARRAVAAADDPRRRRPEPARGPAGARGAGLAPLGAAVSRRASRCTTPRRPISSTSPTPDGRRCWSTASSPRPISSSASRLPRPCCTAGPGALLGACGPRTLRASTAYSLLETAAARGWQLGLALERALATRVPVIGASLVLNPPRLQGRFRGYPYDDASLKHLVASPLRRYSLLPSGLRRRILQDLGRELTAVAAFAGPPSVAHAEALLRGIARRATRLEQPLDALVIGMPWKHHHSPRERLNPITVATVALGLALRLWRDAFPDRRGRHRDRAPPALAPLHARNAGSVPLALPCAPRRPHDARSSPTAEQAAATDERGLAAYRAGRACHPLLPYADWDELQARARPARRRRDRRLPRPPGRAHARVRPHARAPDRARDGARPRRRRSANRLHARPALLPARSRLGLAS